VNLLKTPIFEIGDFNAQIGNKKDSWEEVMGLERHGHLMDTGYRLWNLNQMTGAYVGVSLCQKW